MLKKPKVRASTTQTLDKSGNAGYSLNLHFCLADFKAL